MYEIVKEVTVWTADCAVPNHTYLMSKSGDLIAYAVEGTNEIRKSTIKIDRARRKFVKVNHAGLEKLIPKVAKTEAPRNGRLFKVKSKDKEYLVELIGNRLSCSCIGFGYRGKCKHADAVRNKIT